MEQVTFHATEVFGQNGRFVLDGIVPASDFSLSRPV